MIAKTIKTSLLTAALFATSIHPAGAVTSLYPDLKTLPPDDIQYDTEEIDGSEHVVLRFGNTVWNAGEGPLEIYGTQATADRTRVTQRIYDDSDGSIDSEVGFVVFHDAHNHWHFENFAEYQLWVKEEYDAWVANGRQEQDLHFHGYKTTFCIRETVLVERLPGTPEQTNTECGQEKQGLAVGWGDKYEYNLPEQWIDLGTSELQDGDYVIRSVADPMNLLKESPDNDPSRESAVANEAVTAFSVRDGEIVPYNGTPPEPTHTPPTHTTPTPTPGPIYPTPGHSDHDYDALIRELEDLRAQILAYLRTIENNRY